MPRASAHPWILFLGLILLAPPAAATLSVDVVFDMEAPDRYVMTGELVYRDGTATQSRDQADRNDDGNVTGEEASRAKAELTASLEHAPTSAHTMDGPGPTNITVLGLESQGLRGPVDNTSAMVMGFTSRYTYEIQQADQHVFRLEREPPAPHRHENITILAPHGWRITNLTGLAEAGAHWDANASRGIAEGQPTGTWGFTLVPHGGSQPVRAQPSPPPADQDSTSGDQVQLVGEDPDPAATEEEASTPSPGLVAILMSLGGLALARRRP